MNLHRKFIMSPASSVLREMVAACHGIENGIQSIPVKDYMMQSAFLRLTGAQEQKLKCIIWEMATIDYGFRVDLLGGRFSVSECSSMDDKKKVYKHMTERICQLKGQDHSNFSLPDDFRKDTLDEVGKEILDIFDGALPSVWCASQYKSFPTIWRRISCRHYCDKGALLNDPLKKMYDFVYQSRNRYAHNTLSYQENCPKFDLMTGEKAEYNNYFLWFAILMLMDKVFVWLYTELMILEKSNL